MLVATFRLQYCWSSSGDEIDCLHVAICSTLVHCYWCNQSQSRKLSFLWLNLLKSQRWTLKVIPQKKKLNNSFLNFKEYRIFSRLFDIANQLRTRHSPLGQADQCTVEPSPFSIQGHFSEFVFWNMAAKTLKNPYRSQWVTFKLS